MKPKGSGRLIPLFGAIASLALLVVPVAAQGTNVWERVRHPEVVAEARAREEVERLLFEIELLGHRAPFANDRLRLALRTLEAANAAHARDIRLRFHLGRLLGLLGEHARAAEVLEAALEEAPSHPMAAEASFRLAIASTWLGDRERELSMYDAFLRNVTSPSARAVALSNRAEAEMARGDLRAAIQDYRASLAIVPDPVATWGLAVALDRSGDFAAAVLEADRAHSLDPDDERLNGDGIFFLPAYERHWYEALGAMARARRAETAPDACLAWRATAAAYASYIESADDGDRWLPIAKARRALSEREAARPCSNRTSMKSSEPPSNEKARKVSTRPPRR